MTKFIFTTGGVISSLGKGIASASIAKVLESRGLKVSLIKLVPGLCGEENLTMPDQPGNLFGDVAHME